MAHDVNIMHENAEIYYLNFKFCFLFIQERHCSNVLIYLFLNILSFRSAVTIP